MQADEDQRGILGAGDGSRALREWSRLGGFQGCVEEVVAEAAESYRGGDPEGDIADQLLCVCNESGVCREGIETDWI